MLFIFTSVNFYFCVCNKSYFIFIVHHFASVISNIVPYLPRRMQNRCETSDISLLFNLGVVRHSVGRFHKGPQAKSLAKS